MEEKLLIAGCRRGEQWARKKIYEQHAPIMMGVCMRYVNDRETARDLLQDGFIKIYTKIDTYSETGSFVGWMRRIFVTTALEHLRRNNTLKINVNIDEYENYADDFDISALDRLSADELMACVIELPQGFRTVFNLFAIEGYSHSEIAAMLNVKESTSRSQYVRARKVLQEKVLSLIMHENVGK